MKRLLFSLLFCSALFGKYECPDATPVYFSVKHREARGIGYDDGYTTVSGIVIPRVTDRFFPFAEGRLHIFNDGRFASNVGLGARVGLPWGNYWALGANAYWDHREASKMRVDGLGLGLEALSHNVDFRVNGYLPSGKTGKERLKFAHFSGNTVVVSQKFYRAIPSIFGEVGVPIPIKARFVDLYFAAGPYYLFERKIKNQKEIGGSWGVKGRLENQVIGGFSLAIEASYDKEFHGVVQGVAKLSFPLGPRNIREGRIYWKIKNRRKNCREKAKWDHVLTRPVERNEIIPIDDRKFFTPLIDPQTGLPITLIFVNNLATAPGVGTFEHPFPSLKRAGILSGLGGQIYVFAGDGTSSGMDEGFVFQEGQKLFGSGMSHTLGGVVVPAQTMGNTPTITNQNGAGITMASKGELVGFVIEGASEHGLITKGASGAIIHSNTIQNNTRSGIDVTNTPEITIVNNTITRNGSDGIFSYNSKAGGETHFISGNTISNNSNKGIYYYFVGENDLTITNNSVTGNGAKGIEIFSNMMGNGPNIAIFKNEISENAGQGILLLFSKGAKEAKILDNRVSNNGSHGIYIKQLPTRSPIEGRALIERNYVRGCPGNFDPIHVDVPEGFFSNVQGNRLH